MLRRQNWSEMSTAVPPAIVELLEASYSEQIGVQLVHDFVWGESALEVADDQTGRPLGWGAGVSVRLDLALDQELFGVGKILFRFDEDFVRFRASLFYETVETQGLNHGKEERGRQQEDPGGSVSGCVAAGWGVGGCAGFQWLSAQWRKMSWLELDRWLDVLVSYASRALRRCYRFQIIVRNNPTSISFARSLWPWRQIGVAR